MLTPIIGYFEMLAPVIAGNHYCEDVLDINSKSLVFTTTQFFQKILVEPGMTQDS